LETVLTTPIDAYELLDFGNGRRLERLGDYVLNRPDPRAGGRPQHATWTADWTYQQQGVTGVWVPKREGLPRHWALQVEGQTQDVSLQTDGSSGFYPEEVLAWRWIRQRLDGMYDLTNVSVLNLFAGSGGATAAALQAGASVTHVDTRADRIERARARMPAGEVTWVQSDIMGYVEQALRERAAFDFIVLDPPALDRDGQRSWDIDCDLIHLLRHLPRLMTEQCLGLWCSQRDKRWSPQSLEVLLREDLTGGEIETFELGLATADGRSLAAGIAAVWTDDDAFMQPESAGEPLSAVRLEQRLDRHIDSALMRRNADPARALAELERTAQDFVLQWAEVLARTNMEMAFQFVAYADKALKAMDESSVEAWLVHAMDVYDRAGLHPAIKEMQAVDNFIRNNQQRARGMAFEEVAAVLEHFVHGLNGRRLKLEAGGTAAYTDTQNLYLPNMVTRFSLREDNFRLYKAMVCHQWAQTWFGTWRVDLARALQCYADSERALGLFHALETRRLNACLARQLPGAYREMQQLCESLNEPLVPPGWQAIVTPLEEPQAGVYDTLNQLRAIYADTGVPARLCYQGRLVPDKVAAVQASRIEREKAEFRSALARLADDRRLRLQDMGLELPSPETDISLKQSADPDAPEGVTVELQMDGQPVSPQPDVEALMTSIRQDLGEIPEDYLVPAGDGGYRMQPHAEEDASRDVWKGTYHEQGAHVYNEWDFKRRHYRKNWCILREVEVSKRPAVFVRQTLARHSGLVKDIRRTFEALRGEDRLLKKQAFGDEVDIDALVEAHADTLAGMEMTDRLFTRMHKVERNIAVMFMVDMSGSTKGWINDAERESLVLLCEALEILGDRYAIYGFSGMTRKRCELFRIKHFEEDYSDAVRERISGIRPQDYTRMGVTIRHLTRLLEDVEARTKLLITLSDGKPDDYDGYRGEYGIEDTRMALIEAKRKGVHPFCITIDRQGHDYLPHMYGAVNYTLVDEVSKLPLKVSDIYRRLTT